MGYYLILDIGGTKTTTVVFDESGVPVTDFNIAPSRTYEGKDAVFQNTIEQAYKTLYASGVDFKEIIAIGVAAPGPLDYKTGRIIDVPMMGWKDFPLGDKLHAEFKVPVFVENDGNLGALAEANIGVAKGKETVLYQTISTGCGGGIAINGRIFHGHSGFAGELGHVSINFAGPKCGCGGSGCFELYASGTAVNQRMRRDLKCGIKSLAFEYVNYDADKLNGKLLTDAAAEGDMYSISLLQQEGYYIGVGLSNLINIWDPDIIVLAGGIVKAHEWFWADMMNEVRRHACFEVSEDRIVVSELNDQVVSYGAYTMVKLEMEGKL